MVLLLLVVVVVVVTGKLGDINKVLIVRVGNIVIGKGIKDCLLV